MNYGHEYDVRNRKMNAEDEGGAEVEKGGGFGAVDGSIWYDLLLVLFPASGWHPAGDKLGVR